MNPIQFFGTGLLGIVIFGIIAFIIVVAVLRAVFSIGTIVKLLEEIKENTKKNQPDSTLTH